jgi:hypothetical protein
LHQNYIKKILFITVIKLGLAQQVDPGPGGWTGSGKTKDQPEQKPGESTHDPSEPKRDPVFFFQMWFFFYTPFFIFF